MESEKKFSALQVKQWLPEWDDLKWNPAEHRATPPSHFYQFSMPASLLKRLSGIYPRTTDRKRSAEDLGIQRRHDPRRSEEISRFVKYGYPWSDLSDAKRNSKDFLDLRQPGWLPTAIVINILTSGDKRKGKSIDPSDTLSVVDENNRIASVSLPESYKGLEWVPKEIAPIEVIDGQHRLWAFNGDELEGEYELPVIAFVGLDLSWQAYLFYTINIKPKKINASLAFDLYPLLRTEDWLNKTEGHVIYRETRAQELVDLLWSHENSPWYHRINMLGEPGYKGLHVSQSAWVRSLVASFIKSWEGRGVQIGGLFGSKVGEHHAVLPWARADQAAFLIVLGQQLENAISSSSGSWADDLRSIDADGQLDLQERDLAFVSQYCLLNQDQGIRSILHIYNDYFYLMADNLHLDGWGSENPTVNDIEQLSYSIETLKNDKRILNFICELSESLATFDWRSASVPGLAQDERTYKSAYRGSGGYRMLREHVLSHLSRSSKGKVSDTAKQIIEILGY
ncbi:DGQHR domain-containing protein [bacterium]|nr:DGQHR domain-containing protein [bacterium]